MRIVALIPAHQEQDSIGRTIGALLDQDRLPDLTVVIADNCADATYERAIQAAEGHPEVIVVRTPANSNRKPGALNWAWNRYGQDADLLVTLDADTSLPPHAVSSWEREFGADPRLGGSSSKFTMPAVGGGGGNLLVRLQRAEFARWTMTGLRRGWTSVLAGTACAIRNSVLKEVAGRGDRVGPWSYRSDVEDFELTYRVRELGYRCHISPTVRAYTDAMPTVRALWGQRMKWQAGTCQDLLRFGFNRLTALDWRQQAAGMFAALARVAWLTFLLAALAAGALHLTLIWLLPTAAFIANDTRQSLLVPHRDKWDVLMAVVLVPQEMFAWLRAGWFLASWWQVLNGQTKDRWALQYRAELQRG
ncbi:MAG: glycosyltransferase family 2 protein [Solirubrobacterales bacterium]|nr:glycosyltransferase family 2 protein [Solirubrobacterales bacterium]MBV9362925.1 glycosyltransferase family 2 protein [Solirubrobacterales bacterium]MBV9681319.1 glycosyltransferase family 2 protein [Solirubrobacterales bacterium]MBV9807135.1 glycosyltransferase family 2 protein [Solirubrobacterales bacterium]